MVVLTYHSESDPVKGSATNGPESLENDVADKLDGPKTAYIDKMFKFSEEIADEEKCDMFFICQDGEVATHRLVISNASKYIMAMQNDQPPWYPVYITVPDLTKDIVQTLVQLAYTGQMNIPPSITSDDVYDAMQALGWVHTDCLTATYMDSLNSTMDEENDSLEMLKLRKKVPRTNRVDRGASDDDEVGMEMELPDVPISDDEGDKSITEINDKNETANQRRKPGRRPGKNISASKNTTPKKVKSATPSIKKPTQPSTSPGSSDTRKRGGGRKVNDLETESSPAKNEMSDDVNAVEVSSEPETVRSRTRTIRKPKKFDDAIVLTPTKRKESPVKSPSKGLAKNSKEIEADATTPVVGKTPKKKASVRGTRASEEPAGSSTLAPRNKTRNSSDKDTPKNSLITSYFTKRSPRKSDDFSSDVTSQQQTDGNDDLEIIVEKSAVNNEANESSKHGGTNRSQSQEFDEKTPDISSTSSTSTLRRRAKSTASSKSDKDTVQDETKDSLQSTGKSTRRKRNFQESQSSESGSGESTNPTRRGRKPSTVSNASNKDSITDGNQEDQDMDNAQDIPKKKRSRQE